MSKDKILLPLVIILLFLTGCKKSHNESKKDYILDFIVNNIVAPEEFSFPYYFSLKDENGDAHTIDSIFTKPLLVFRFGENNCEVCIQAELDIINIAADNVNIIGLASYSTFRAMKLAKSKYNINFPVYFLPFGESELVLPNSMEKYGSPYLFFMGTNYQAKHIFLPHKQFPEVSKEYYHAISDILGFHTANPEIFDSTVIDLGVVKTNQTHEIKFNYTNKYSVPLIINDVKTSCGCSVPHWNKKPLASNTSSELTVLFTPESQGYTFKTIMVFHNQSKNPIRLSFKSNVE